VATPEMPMDRLRQLSELIDDLFSRSSITAMLIGCVFWSENL